jgi:hypothetical protein
MSRIGKIARLPRDLRDQLNHRLQDGENGVTLVEWLNAQPKVRAVLKKDFEGRPISEQNLSDWKQGGYRDWERHEETRALVRDLAERSGDLETDSAGLEISQRFSTVLAAELVRATQELLAQTTDPRERWDLLRQALQELVRLRKEDHKAAHLAMDRERQETESRREREKDEKRKEAEIKFRATAPHRAILGLVPMVQMYGGGEAGVRMAVSRLEMEHDLERGSLIGTDYAGFAAKLKAAIRANQEESSQIAVDQGKSSQIDLKEGPRVPPAPEAAIETETPQFHDAVDGLPLSLGEREGVRASVNPNPPIAPAPTQNAEITSDNTI